MSIIKREPTDHTKKQVKEIVKIIRLERERRKREQSLDKDCIIWTMFQDANDPRWHQLEYCQKNCQYKCLNGKDYKKI